MENTSMLKIHKPSLEDLWFKEKLLSDKDTMSYNHNYGGTIAFPKQKWNDWYNRWLIDDSRYYRYLKDCNNEFIGEIAYYQNGDRTMCNVIVLASERGKGYGTLALQMLCDIAKSNGIRELYDDIALDNQSIGLFLKSGFIEISRNEETITVKKIL